MPKDKPDVVLTRMLTEKPMTKTKINANIKAQRAKKNGPRRVN
jgi:hypothetical protein